MDTACATRPSSLAEGVDLLLCEATYLERDAVAGRRLPAPHRPQAATIAAEAGARRLVLTHFSSRYDDLEAHRREAAEVFDNVVVATDLAVIPFADDDPQLG